MRQKVFLISGFVLTAMLLTMAYLSSTTLAHGTEIAYRVTTAIEITAAFDSGEPMANAQVVVYAPNNPAEAWLTGEADEAGRFMFSPDPDIPGTWDVSIRTAGHGEMVHIPLDNNGVALAGVGGGNNNPMQIILMSAAVIWGFIGTALYFSRGSKPDARS